MIILVKFAIVFLSVICAVYLFVYFKKRGKKTDSHFAFKERQKDLQNFFNEFYSKDAENHGDWLIEKFKKEYPDYYNQIDKKFINNYFKS